MGKEELEQLKKELRAQLTPAFLRSLVRYADYLIAIHFWRGRQGGEVLPRGESSESIVQQIIGKMLDFQNRWDEKSIDLEEYLRNCIRRDVGHLSRLQENVKTRTLEAADLDLMEPVWPCTSEESTEWVTAFKELLRSRDETQLLDIVKCMMGGAGRPREIAETLAIDVNVVYRAKRKLKRLLGEFLEQRAAVSAKES